MSGTPITASLLYDLIQCPHRVSKDQYHDPADRDPISPFIQLLWERGNLFEREVIDGLKVPYTDLSRYAGDEKERMTLEAMDRGDELIYGGRLTVDELIGDPDLLRKDGAGYVPGDIKCGAGEEGPEDNKRPKMHYGVQLAIYADILEQLERSGGRLGFIWDVYGDEVMYDLAAPKGPRTPSSLWDDYEEALAQAKVIVANEGSTDPAYGSVCKECHWYTACLGDMQDSDDLTLIPELGRSRREPMLTKFSTVSELAAIDPEDFVEGKKTQFPGIGPDRLRRFHARAKLRHDGGAPQLLAPVEFPELDKELFFDIEFDPMRDLCYLHGFVERNERNNETEMFVSFFAERPTPEAEEAVFAEAVTYMQASQPCATYYYSKYERTIYRKLREKYPDVIAEEALEALFDPATAIDLYYDVVLKCTDWPTIDFSIKTLAKFLGFEWRDAHPSGSASIEWFHSWVETGDPEIRQRILDYNEDDCRATRVLLDGIRAI